MDFVVVFVTAATNDEAVKIAHALVEENLAACCNIVENIRSIYRWEGKINDEKEVLLLIKSKKSDFDKLEKTVLSLHSYKTPEIIALPISAGSKPYLKWLDEKS